MMTIAKSTLFGLLTSAAASASAYGFDGGNPSPYSAFYYAVVTLCLMALPALYIIFRRGAPWSKRLIWLLALVAVHLGSLGVTCLVFSSHSTYALLTPVPYVMALIPGYILANCYKVAIDSISARKPTRPPAAA